jgi:hypothetical protein
MPYGSRFVQQLNRTVAQRRAEWHNLSRISGKTIAELDRDLTAPDPREDEHYRALIDDLREDQRAEMEAAHVDSEAVRASLAASDKPLCQDDYEFLTKTGQYKE